MNTYLLMAKLYSRKITQKELAKRLEIDRSTLYRKLSGASVMTVSDVRAITRELNLSQNEIMDIFFSEQGA